ncbi:MAG: hypothetical protein ACI4PF_02345 [Christensenellales bacterium]
MNRPMFDMMMRGRDGRNPYGSRGGYITYRDPRRRDRAMSEEMYNRGREPRDYEEDYARRRNSRGQYMRDRGAYPFEVSGEFEMYDRHHYDPYMMGEYGGRDYGYDYAYDEDVMSKQELDQKYYQLLGEVEESEKEKFSKERILKRAEEMGIKFDKFSPESLVVATVMVYTDYCKTLGKGNLDTYILLAKDFLIDPDSKLKGDEKLTAYFDYVVM